ncbi:MAG: cysteine hydrolase family protein [Pseudomonadota bacterium]
MSQLPQDAVLVVVDVQQAFDDPQWGERNNPAAESNIAALLAHWRRTERPIIHIHHRSARPGSLFHPDHPGFKVKPEAAPLPDEPVIHKAVNSAFIGTDLEQRLRARGAEVLVIVGITSDQCVSTTARMAGNFGFTAFVVSDATATFERRGANGRHFSAVDMHETALASLHTEFATVLDSASMRARL